MRYVLGIDVGSTTAKLAVLSDAGELVYSARRRHSGRPVEVLRSLCEGIPKRFDIVRTCVTGSTGVTLGDVLDADVVHEVQAVTLAAERLHPGFRTVVELGGQDAKILVRSADGHIDAQMNDRCAAGTGATFDRIARRVGVSESALAALALRGDLRVASKCGVFAETDIVNWMQRGASVEEAVSALARAIVAQNLNVLARGRCLVPPVVLLGGPHAHLPVLVEAWRRELHATWRQNAVAVGAIDAPKDGDLYGALGAALHAADAPPRRRVERAASQAVVSTHDGPLVVNDDDRAELEQLRCATAPQRLPRGPLEVLIGLDAGSTTVKSVLVDRVGRVLMSRYAPSTGHPLLDVRSQLQSLWAAASEAQCELEVKALGVTGYGKELLGPLLGADAAPVETEAHAQAAMAVDPQVEVVVDVGGTDIKVLSVRKGEVRDFFVSNQCSAGHGAFVAATAADLGVPMDQAAERALRAARAPRFCVGCAVFMDSDRVSLQRDGYDVDEILAGLAKTVARNVWEFVVPHAPAQLGRRFVLTGGTQRNLAVAWEQRSYLRKHVPGVSVMVHPYPELSGAIGAAMRAQTAVAASSRGSAFVGLSALERLSLQARSDESLRCTRCALSCARTELRLDDGVHAARTWFVGNTCERGADLSTRARRSRSHAVDLFSEEATTLFRWPGKASPQHAAYVSKGAPVFGIPRVLCMYRAAPLLLGYLHAAGVPRHHVIWSPITTAAMFQDGARRGVNDPCFPSKLVHAHVDWLLQRKTQLGLTELLLPAITHAAVVTSGTADRAACPIVTASGHVATAPLHADASVLQGVMPLTGDLNLSDVALLREQMREMFAQRLGLGSDAHDAAFDAALRYARERAEAQRARGERVLSRARTQGRAVVLVLARPYHADPGVSHGVTTELAARGIAVLGLTALPLHPDGLRDLTEVASDVTNSGSGEKLWGARAVAAHPNLLALDLSSFRCGHDASILGALSASLAKANKPALLMHDLDEDRPHASFRLRIDTFVSALRRYEREVLEPRAKVAVGSRERLTWPTP